MDSLSNLMMGFGIAMQPNNLLFGFLGSVMGTLVGLLPGLGPAATLAMLLPISSQLDPTAAIIMMSAIFHGAQYAGVITAVLMNVPGEGSTAITCVEGYPMAKKGRAGAVLSIAPVAAFLAANVSALAVVLAAAPLVVLALKFGPSETFALLTLGMAMVTTLTGKSKVKGLMMGVFGLMLAMVGTDPMRGLPRYTLGKPELIDGIGLLPVVMGIFGLAELLENAERALKPVFLETSMSSLRPTRQEARDSVGPVVRGTAVGMPLGMIPGITNATSAFLSYALEQKVSKHPEKFGTGIIEGVAGPEAAANSHAMSSMIPLLTLGIPVSPGLAVLMSALIMNGLQPGPLLFENHPHFVWAVIASFYVANLMLLVLNLPLIGVWVRFTTLPYSVLFAIIACVMLVGAYTISNSGFSVGMMALLGFVGYILRKQGFPMAPVALTLILEPLWEKALRRCLEGSEGDFSVFLQSPLSTGLLVMAALMILYPIIPAARAHFARGRQIVPASGND